MSRKKNIKVFAMILLTSTLLILALSAANVLSAKAQTTETLVIYPTLGLGSVSANGTAMVTTSTGNTLNSGDTYTFTATASSGFQLIGWAYADKNGPSGSSSASFSKVISQSCALEAIFVPTTNTTATSGSGASTIVLFGTEGGTTNPTGDAFTGTTMSGTIGTAMTISQTPGTDYTFLCWVVTDGTANSEYTSSTLTYAPATSGVAIEPLWIASGSGVTLPTIPEFSAAIVAVLAVALVAAAVGAFAFKKIKRN